VMGHIAGCAVDIVIGAGRPIDNRPQDGILPHKNGTVARDVGDEIWLSHSARRYCCVSDVAAGFGIARAAGGELVRRLELVLLPGALLPKVRRASARGARILEPIVRHRLL
jgi:hypothetical protein